MRLNCALAYVAFCATTISAVITGSTQCNNVLCVTGLHDSKINMDTYTMTGPEGKAIPRDKFGWMAIGFGQTMAYSPMIIAWPNSNGSITLSQREAPSSVMPTTRRALLLKERSYANSTGTSITFTIPSAANATAQTLDQNFLIYAYSSKNPRSSNGAAPIQVHDYSGSFSLSLAAKWTSSRPTNSTGTDSSSTSAGAGSTGGSSRKALIAHAVCGGLATLAFLPIGTVIPRIARGFSMNRWWFPAHGVFNGVLGGLCTLIAFAIAKAAFGDHSDGSDHRRLGLALFLLVLLQTALGSFVHWYKSPFYSLQAKSGRGPSNFIHMVFGVLIVVVGWATAWTGAINVGWKVVWGLVVACTTLAYLYGLVVLLPKQRAMETQARLRHSGVVGSKMHWPEPNPEQQGTSVEMSSRKEASA